MKLHRYVLAYFSPTLSQAWEQRSATIGHVEVTISPRETEDGRGDRRLLTASVPLPGLPPKDDDGRVLIPERERLQCEEAIEHATNLMSVLDGASRTLLSPLLCAALGPENEQERAHLAESKGILPIQRNEQAAGSRIEWSPEIAAALSDRMDGVAMLAEAFSAGGELGMYRDFVRFLELAFARGFYDKRLAKKLTQFLAPGYGYTRDEIDQWAKLRHPSTHADYQKSAWIALTSDVRPVILRMRQACLDVLFNKTKWHETSSGRRDAWRPDAITTSKAGEMVVRQGSKLTLNFRSYDEFGVYPRKLEISVDHTRDGLYATFYQDDLMRQRIESTKTLGEPRQPSQ